MTFVQGNLFRNMLLVTSNFVATQSGSIPGAISNGSTTDDFQV